MSMVMSLMSPNPYGNIPVHRLILEATFLVSFLFPVTSAATTINLSTFTDDSIPSSLLISTKEIKIKNFPIQNNQLKKVHIKISIKSRCYRTLQVSDLLQSTPSFANEKARRTEDKTQHAALIYG